MKMCHCINTKSGFTLVEVVVAVLVFSLSIAGLLSVLANLNRPAAESFEEVQAIYAGKEFLENLRQAVDASTWDDSGSALAPAVHTTSASSPSGMAFNAVYNVTSDTSGGRWVDLNINWE